MKMKRVLLLVILLIIVDITAACSGTQDDNSLHNSINEQSENITEQTKKQIREAVVLTLTEKRTLRFSNIIEGTLSITSGPDKSGIVYTEGKDYIVDYDEGTITRLSGSRIPDFSNNSTYGAGEKTVDLNIVNTNFHALPYTVYAEYEFLSSSNDTYEEVLAEINRRNRAALPEGLLERIALGGELVYAVIGDSISTGGEASKPEYTYFNLFAKYLESLNSELTVRIVNVAVAGDSSNGILDQVDKLYNALGEKPELISIAFGMNDQNSLEKLYSTSPKQYVSNHEQAIEKILKLNSADPETAAPYFILITAMPANPIWNYTSGSSELLADELRDYAKSEGLPLADAGSLFNNELSRGKNYNEIITSNINHPGDYGHLLYFYALRSLFE